MGNAYIRQSSADIVTGLVVEAEPLNREFNALRDAFAATTGHTHDDTTGEGPKIALATSISGILPVANGGFGGIHKTNGTTAPTANEDTGDGYAVGSIWVDTTNDRAYVAVDVSAAAAVWVFIGATGGWQPLDTDLTQIAALVSAADKVPYATGAGTWALADFTAYGRSLVAVASEAAFKALVNLEIGVDVQAFDAQLSDVAGLTPTDDGVIIGNGTNFVVESGATLKTSLGLTIGTNVQAFDATLTQVAALDGTAGYLVMTGADTFAKRTLTGTANQVVITNGDGTSGNPVFSLPQSIATTSSPTFANPTFTTIELGAGATDTTLTRVSAGIVAVEGSNLIRAADLGTGVATFLATPSSANLATAVTDETGTGGLVFANTPTLITPKGIHTLGTPVVTTSGTTADFTGIPTDTKVIHIMFDAVSLNGADAFLIQLGDSGGIENSGYVSVFTSLLNTPAINNVSTTTGFAIGQGGAALAHTGVFTLTLGSSATNKWFFKGQLLETTTPFSVNSTGSKALTAVLDRVRITTTGGGNQFDAGAINILYSS